MSLPSFIRSACAGIALLAVQSSFGVIIPIGDGSGNTTAPGSGTGWDYVGLLGSGGSAGTGIYLGQYNSGYWVMTANHVPVNNFVVGANTYTYVAGSSIQIGTLDLKVFRIDIPEGDTTLLGLSNLSLSSTAPIATSSVMMIGGGRDRQVAETTWFVDTNPPSGPYVWSESFFAGADAIVEGYKWQATRTQRWGTNVVEGYGAGGSTNYLVTDFDDNGSDAQAAVGDSGGGVFYFNGTNWELSGLMVGVQTFSGQPGETSAYNNTTVAISMAHHGSQVLAAIPEPGTILLITTGLLTITLARRRKRR